MFALILIAIPVADGNPVPYYPTFTAKDGNPIPAVNDTDVYLAEELLIFTFSSKSVDVQAEYLFRNDGPYHVNLSIFLPFNDTATVFDLKVDGIDHSYQEYQMDLHRYYWWGSGRSYHGVLFGVSFGPHGSRNVSIGYQRELHVSYDYEDNDKLHHSFNYMVWTTKYWNHSIDRARFEFWLPRSLYEEIDYYDFNSSYESGKYTVLVEEYEDWSPSDYYGEVGINWWRFRPEEPDVIPQIFLIGLGSIAAVIVFFGSWEYLDRRKSRK